MTRLARQRDVDLVIESVLRMISFRFDVFFSLGDDCFARKGDIQTTVKG